MLKKPRDAIPPDVKRALRREVGFGCPICRSPFLTWHHFDPPYHVEPHNRPEGMIALCREHHDEADQGLFSPDELRSLKQAQRSTEDVKGNYPSWRKPNILLRIGGSYVGGSMAVLSVVGNPVIALSRNEEDMLSLSFSLHNQEGRPVVIMEENAFEAYPENIHDLAVATRKGSIKVWLASANIGLELTFDRITLDELDNVLAKDKKRSDEKSSRVIQSVLNSFPQHVHECFNEAIAGPRMLPPGSFEGLPEHILNGWLSGDPTGYGVRDWVLKKCLDDEKKVPFLNFEQLAIYNHGERITIRNGIGRIHYCAAFESWGAFNLGCPCKACSAVSSTTQAHPREP